MIYNSNLNVNVNVNDLSSRHDSMPVILNSNIMNLREITMYEILNEKISHVIKSSELQPILYEINKISSPVDSVEYISRLLEDASRKTIWIGNRIGLIDLEYIERFDTMHAIIYKPESVYSSSLHLKNGIMGRLRKNGGRTVKDDFITFMNKLNNGLGRPLFNLNTSILFITITNQTHDLYDIESEDDEYYDYRYYDKLTEHDWLDVDETCYEDDE